MAACGPKRRALLFLFKGKLVIGCALLMGAAGCIAQQGAPAAENAGSGSGAVAGAAGSTMAPPDALTATSPLSRKVEIMIREELGVPPEYQMTIGEREKSDVTGYDTIPVTFFLPNAASRRQTVDFLLSKDGNTLARLSKWNIGPNPAEIPAAEGRPVRGNAAAKVTIVNFDDLECPFCARMNAEFFPDTLDHYKGLVNFVYVDYPLVQIHPWAMHAAVDANCLAAETASGYWNYVNYLHTHGEDVSGPDHDPGKSAKTLDKLADEEGGRDHVDGAKLDACIAKQDDSGIIAEMKAGDKLGVDATPTFFVNGERWAGQLDEPQLWMMIDRALREQGIAPPASAPPAAGDKTPTK